MKRENGNILITVIFLMVILLIVAIGITSVGSGGVENTVLKEQDIKSTENAESIGQMIKNATNWGTGEDRWINTADIAPDIFGRNRLIMKMFIDNKSSDMSFSLPALTSGGAIYVTAIKNNFTGFSMNMAAAPDAASRVNFVNNISKDAKARAFKSISSSEGDYRISITSGDSEEYIVFVRVFCRE